MNTARPAPARVLYPVAGLMLLSLLFRLIPAFLTEFGNDEVYYVLYGWSPAQWSYFDHPAMIGWLMRTMELLGPFDSEGILRFFPLLFGTLNIPLIYGIGKHVGGARCGLLCAALYSGSPYGLITGTLILPDAPQIFFWLTAVNTVCVLLNKDAGSPKGNPVSARYRYMLWTVAGLGTGFALMSKYHAVFLPAGIFMFALLHRRQLFREIGFWWAGLLAVSGVLPTAIWNIENDWISFRFHSARVLPEEGLDIWGLLLSLTGQLLYQHPVSVFLIVSGIISVFALKQLSDLQKLLLWTTLPLLITFTGISLFRQTLPHWTGPAFITLLPFAALRLVQIYDARRQWKIPTFIGVSSLLLIILVTLQLRMGLLYPRENATGEMFGWRDAGRQWATWLKEHNINPAHTEITGYDWYPAAHYCFYLARPIGGHCRALGEVRDIHHFAWRPPNPQGIRTFYLRENRQPDKPIMKFSVPPIARLPIVRGGYTAKTIDIYDGIPD